jgi:hypothetical protein
MGSVAVRNSRAWGHRHSGSHSWDVDIVWVASCKQGPTMGGASGWVARGRARSGTQMGGADTQISDGRNRIVGVHHRFGAVDCDGMVEQRPVQRQRLVLPTLPTDMQAEFGIQPRQNAAHGGQGPAKVLRRQTKRSHLLTSPRGQSRQITLIMTAFRLQAIISSRSSDCERRQRNAQQVRPSRAHTPSTRTRW